MSKITELQELQSLLTTALAHAIHFHERAEGSDPTIVDAANAIRTNVTHALHSVGVAVDTVARVEPKGKES